MKTMTKKAPATPAYRVLLSSCGNPDFGQYAPISPRGAVDVETLKEARDCCEAYIEEFNLGGGNWDGGQVIDNKTGKKIATFSYNLRLWSVDDKSEMVIG